MHKIYLSPENRPAPHGRYTGYPGVYEHDVCYEIAELEKAELERHGLSVTIAARGKKMADRAKEANTGKYDVYQTLHTNAGGGTGTECFFYNHPLSIKLNQLLYDELTKLYPSKRGLKDGAKFYENANTNMVSGYPEIAFHDNPNDARFIVENKKAIAIALAKAVLAYLGIAYVPEATRPPEVDYKALYEAEKDAREKAETKLIRIKGILEG